MCDVHGIIVCVLSLPCVPRHAKLLQTMKVLNYRGTISLQEWEACGVYRVFAFRTKSSSIIPQPKPLFPGLLDFALSRQLFRQPQEVEAVNTTNSDGTTSSRGASAHKYLQFATQIPAHSILDVFKLYEEYENFLAGLRDGRVSSSAAAGSSGNGAEAGGWSVAETSSAPKLVTEGGKNGSNNGAAAANGVHAAGMGRFQGPPVLGITPVPVVSAAAPHLTSQITSNVNNLRGAQSQVGGATNSGGTVAPASAPSADMDDFADGWGENVLEADAGWTDATASSAPSQPSAAAALAAEATQAAMQQQMGDAGDDVFAAAQAQADQALPGADNNEEEEEEEEEDDWAAGW